MNANDKKIIIIEGADGTGKSSLSRHIQTLANGKCHVLHSNYNKNLPGENNYKQHILMTNFACKQFSPKYYTGNNIVVLDRNYISDMTYGIIGYGSDGDIHKKFNRLQHIFSIFHKAMLKDEDLQVYLIHCRLNTKKYFGVGSDGNNKEELLDNDENNIIHRVYDELFYPLLYKNDNTENVQNLCAKFGIKFISFNFEEDKQYNKITEALN